MVDPFFMVAFRRETGGIITCTKNYLRMSEYQRPNRIKVFVIFYVVMIVIAAVVALPAGLYKLVACGWGLAFGDGATERDIVEAVGLTLFGIVAWGGAYLSRGKIMARLGVEQE